MILEVCWDGLWRLSLGSHNFMVTALGSCVKWPLDSDMRVTLPLLLLLLLIPGLASAFFQAV